MLFRRIHFVLIFNQYQTHENAIWLFITIAIVVPPDDTKRLRTVKSLENKYRNW